MGSLNCKSLPKTCTTSMSHINAQPQVNTISQQNKITQSGSKSQINQTTQSSSEVSKYLELLQYINLAEKWTYASDELMIKSEDKELIRAIYKVMTGINKGDLQFRLCQWFYSSDELRIKSEHSEHIEAFNTVMSGLLKGDLQFSLWQGIGTSKDDRGRYSQIPDENDKFSFDENSISEIQQTLWNKKIVTLNGPQGVGKISIAEEISNRLKEIRIVMMIRRSHS